MVFSHQPIDQAAFCSCSSFILAQADRHETVYQPEVGRFSTLRVLELARVGHLFGPVLEFEFEFEFAFH